MSLIPLPAREVRKVSAETTPTQSISNPTVIGLVTHQHCSSPKEILASAIREVTSLIS